MADSRAVIVDIMTITVQNTQGQMGHYEKLLARILRGTSDPDIPFADTCRLLVKLGFAERIRGDHHIFTKDNVAEILNLQPKGSKAKPYQVKQVRSTVLRYKLTLEESNGRQI